MSTMASQITSLTIAYSGVYSDADQRKRQSSASLAFLWGIHRWPVNSLHKWPVTRKMFPFDDVIMTYLCPTMFVRDVVKRHLKDNYKDKRIFGADNLTSERSKLLRNFRDSECVKKAFSIGGNLRVILSENGDDRMITIDSLSDITKVGCEVDEIINLGIFEADK